jgi:aminoglycoside phosphotransferase (APT) family kinase protein
MNFPDSSAVAAGTLDAEPEVRQFTSGASNLTYLLRYPGRDLALRRPTTGRQAASAHDMRGEYPIQAWLQADDESLGQFRRQPTHLSGMLTRAEVDDYYAERTGLSVTAQQWLFYEIFGLFRLAAVAQHISYRNHHGQTTNERFAVFRYAVQHLVSRRQGLIR